MTLDIKRDTDEMRACRAGIYDFAMNIAKDAADIRKACREASAYMRDEVCLDALRAINNMADNMTKQGEVALALADRIEKSAKILEESEEL